MTIYASNALRPVAGNQYVPDSMEARGKIRPIPPISSKRNGQGEYVAVGASGFEWRFNTMTQAELDWWTTLIAYDPVTNPVFSKRFVYATLPAARLWDISGEIVEYATAVIDMPKWEEYRNAYYHNVIVTFSGMIAQP